LNRAKIGGLIQGEPKVTMPILVEALLIFAHVSLLFYVEFRSVAQIDVLYDLGLIMAILPLVCIVGGRISAYLMIFPITLMPIAGKTVRQLVYGNEPTIGVEAGWAIYFIIPMIISTLCAVWFFVRHKSRREDSSFAGIGLLVTAWTFFGLNWGFFHFPWPWVEWTNRTPNGIIFTVCVLSLTALVIVTEKKLKRPAEQSG
jgi:hypothetical protein